MKKYLNSYIEYVDLCLEDKKVNIKELKKEHLIKISLFQHERLIHLLVTLFYVILMLLFFLFSLASIWFWVIAFILVIFVLFYVVHYFRLENGVQYLYKQYDKMNKLEK